MPMSSLIPVGAWLWSNYGKSLADKVFKSGKGKWDAAKWETAAKAYRTKIIELYDSMQIMGMAKPVPLDDIFTEAYILDKPTAFGRFDIERLKQMSTNPDKPIHAERINGLKLVVDKDNLFILGKPGAGKTTFLKYIALKAAEQVIDKVPIFVFLKEWSDSKLKLMPFIADQFDICGFPAAQPFVEELLKSGNAIVLFDGLDEVNQESGQRDKQTREMNKYIKKYNQTKYLITCRIAASDYTFEPFDYVEIADFTENQIKTFVGNWFRNKEGEKDKETSKRFLAEFEKEDNKGLRDLARTPLLLTLLCMAFDETLTIPQRRVEIYEEALDALLKKWDSTRRIKRDEIYRKLSLGHKENMLAQIAHETFEKNEYFITQDELERLIIDYIKNVPPHDTNEATDGETILKAIEAQHGIFVERAHRVYSFSHLTFQEYFTAKYIVANAAKGTLNNLIKEHCADERWHEVFVLATSLLADAKQFIISFWHSIDELLVGDKKLQALLKWAGAKSTLIDNEPILVRQSYLLFELFHLAQGSNLEMILLDYFFNIDPEFNSEINLDPNLELDMELDNVRIYARLITTVSTVESNRLRHHSLNSAFTHALNLARKLGLNELTEELAALSIPKYKAATSEWHEFLKKWLVLMRKHRDIGYDWNLTETQETRLADYLNATHLLQDCLNLAFMPLDEKTAMLNSLYLPPAQTEDTQNA